MTKDEGRALAEEGAQRAAEHADRVTPHWTETAYALTLQFLEPGKRFRAEEIRAAAIKAGLPPSPDVRAWGAVIGRLRKEGRIVRVGVEQSHNPSHHRGYSTLWEAVSPVSE